MEALGAVALRGLFTFRTVCCELPGSDETSERAPGGQPFTGCLVEFLDIQTACWEGLQDPSGPFEGHRGVVAVDAWPDLDVVDIDETVGGHSKRTIAR